jgi:hypothetical protein
MHSYLYWIEEKCGKTQNIFLKTVKNQKLPYERHFDIRISFFIGRLGISRRTCPYTFVGDAGNHIAFQESRAICIAINRFPPSME